MDYITDNQEIERTPYRVKLKELNLLLTMNGFSEIGDLFDNSLFSVNKTLTVLKSLLDDRKKLIEAKLKMNILICLNQMKYKKIK